MKKQKNCRELNAEVLASARQIRGEYTPGHIHTLPQPNKEPLDYLTSGRPSIKRETVKICMYEQYLWLSHHAVRRLLEPCVPVILLNTRQSSSIMFARSTLHSSKQISFRYRGVQTAVASTWLIAQGCRTQIVYS